jgi:hypothetical protein
MPRRLPPSTPEPPTPEQTAEYTYDMLVGLRKLASERGQDALAQLLNVAAAEAQSLARGSEAETFLS